MNQNRGGKYITQQNMERVVGNLIPGAEITVTPIMDGSGNATGTVNILVKCEGVVIPEGKLPALILTNTREQQIKGIASDRRKKEKKTKNKKEKQVNWEKIGKIGNGIIAIGSAATLLVAAGSLLNSCDFPEIIPTEPLPSLTAPETEPLSSTTAPETVEETFTINGYIEEDFSVGGMFYYTPNPLNGDGVYEYNLDAFNWFQEDSEIVKSSMEKLHEYSRGSTLSTEQIIGSNGTISLTDIAYELCEGYYMQAEGDLTGTVIPGLGDETLLKVNMDGVLYQQGVAYSNYETANQLYKGAQVIQQASNSGPDPAKGIDTTSVEAGLTFYENETTRDAQIKLNANIRTDFSNNVGTMEEAVKGIEDVLNNYTDYTNQVSLEFIVTDSEGNRVVRKEYSGSKDEIIQDFKNDFELYYENTVESEPQLGGTQISADEVAEVAGTQTRHGLDVALGKFGRLFSRGASER